MRQDLTASLCGRGVGRVQPGPVGPAWRFGALVGEPGRPVAMVELGWRPEDRRALHGLRGELREREEGGLTWLKPVLTCRIRYRLTPAGRLREPLFDGWVVEAKSA